MPPSEAKSKLRERIVQDVAKLIRSVVEVVRKENRPAAGAWSRQRQNDVALGRNAGCLGGVAAGLMDSGGLGVALPTRLRRSS